MCVFSCNKKKFTLSSSHPPTLAQPCAHTVHARHTHSPALPPNHHPTRPPTHPPGQRPHESDIFANNLSHTGRFPLIGWWGIAKRIEYICMGSNLLSTDIPPQLNDYFRDLANISILNSFKEFSQPFNVSFLTKQLHASSTYHQTTTATARGVQSTGICFITIYHTRTRAFTR